MGRLLVVSIALVIVAAVGGYLLFGSVPPCRLPGAELGKYGELSYQLLADTNAYLISLATLLLGSLGAIGMKLGTLMHESDRQHARWVLAIGGIFGVASLAYALYGHIFLAEAAVNECAALSDKLAYTQIMQVLALVLGLVATLYLIFVFLGFERRQE